MSMLPCFALHSSLFGFAISKKVYSFSGVFFLEKPGVDDNDKNEKRTAMKE